MNQNHNLTITTTETKGSSAISSMRTSASNSVSGTCTTNTSLSSFQFPRTGKRGVPQQFPRRLYEMLEGECTMNDRSIDDRLANQPVIQWSSSGRAFCIRDSAAFASHVLPKYFRTSKFSSFQRNLNLYGFSKVRRGPDTDMYAHPYFIRGSPEQLIKLRKGPKVPSASSTKSINALRRRSSVVSLGSTAEDFVEDIVEPTVVTQVIHRNCVSPTSFRSDGSVDTHTTASPMLKGFNGGNSKLGLLTLALTSMADF